MLKQSFSLAILLSFCANDALAQAFLESSALKGLSAGAGGGVAAAVAGQNPLTRNMAPAEVEKCIKQADSLLKTNKKQDAEQLYRTALKAVAKSSGIDSDKGISLAKKLREIEISKGDFKDAANFGVVIYGRTRRDFGPTDPRTVQSQYELSDLYLRAGDNANAAKHLQEAIENARKSDKPPETAKMIEMLDSYTSALRALGREDEANQASKQASELYEQSEKK